MRRRLALFSVAAALVVTAAALLLPTTPTLAEGPTPLQKAVQEMVRAFRQNDKGLRPGITVSETVQAVRGAAHITGGYALPLANTPYDPEGEWQGTISFYIDEDEPDTVFDSFDVALLCEKYDKADMARWLCQSVGPRVGLALERDDEERWLYWDVDATGRDVWISLGDRVILFTVSVVEDE